MYFHRQKKGFISSFLHKYTVCMCFQRSNSMNKVKLYTMFSLTSTSGAYSISKFLGVALISNLR